MDNLVMVLDGGEERYVQGGTVTDLAKVYEDLAYGHADMRLVAVYMLDAGTGTLVAAKCRVDGAGEYDEDSMSYPLVTVTFPNGTTESAGYRVDGRS